MTIDTRSLSLPMTLGARNFIQRTLARAGFSAEQVDAALRLWVRAHERARGNQKVWRDIHNRRLSGASGAPELEVTFDPRTKALATVCAAAKPVFVERKRGQSLSKSLHLDELAAMDIQIVRDTSDGPVADVDPRYATICARAMAGEPHALARLGVATVERQRFPLAFVTDEDRRDPETGALFRREVRALPPGDGEFGVIEFFEQLRIEGRIPLASLEMVKRFVMLVAAPLLREKLTGRLGVYWLTGPPGSGKEFMLEVAKTIWKMVGEPGAQVAVEVRDPSFDEDRKTIATAVGAVYAHLREAGKHGPAMVEQFIRLTGQASLSVRGLYQSPVEIDNTFCFVADSAEPVPDRREIARRTAVIELIKVDRGLESSTMEEVRRHAGRIVSSLRRMVEDAGLEALNVASPEGRPHGLVVLANLLGAELDPVRGEDLSLIFQAMAEYIVSGETKFTRPSEAAKAPAVALRHPNFYTGHFLETMGARPGYRAYFSVIKHANFLMARIEREFADRKQRAESDGHYVVEVEGRPYGFRFVNKRASTFLFYPLDPLGGVRTRAQTDVMLPATDLSRLQGAREDDA